MDRAAETPHQTVLSLQSEGSRPPLFCIHPVGGNVLCYVELARALGTEQPVYGVQATPVAAALPPDALTDLRAALSILSNQGLLPSDTDEAQLAALYALFRRNLRLTVDYQPGRYGGPVLLLQAAADSAAADSGWQSLCSGPLELVGLPGDHYTIVSPAGVGAVARLLHARLLGAG
jgi:thioesterase domain-containing protein